MRKTLFVHYCVKGIIIFITAVVFFPLVKDSNNEPAQPWERTISQAAVKFNSAMREEFRTQTFQVYCMSLVVYERTVLFYVVQLLSSHLHASMIRWSQKKPVRVLKHRIGLFQRLQIHPLFAFHLLLVVLLG